MKKTITILLIATSTTLFGQFGNSDYFLNANVGFAIDNAEQSFVKTHNYSISSIYDNNLTFIELALTSTDFDSYKGYYLKTGGTVTFKYFYPNSSNDSLNSRYSGNLFGFDLLGVNVLPVTKFVDFIITGGVNMGSKKVRLDNVKYKNFIFAPRLTSELRFRFTERLSISGRIEKQFDISKPIWKLKRGVDILALQEFKYSPLMISAGIGWKLM
mgnify:CR=1 FL=1